MAKKSVPFVTSIQEITQTLLASDRVPLDGGAPPFDWESFTSAINSSFHIEDFKIEKVKTNWEEKDAFLSNFGEDLLLSSIDCVPLSGKAFLLYSKQDLTNIYSALFGPANFFTDKEVLNGLRTFFEMNVLRSVEKAWGSQDWSLRLHSTDLGQSLPETAFALDIKTKAGKKPIIFKILLSKELMDAWSAHYVKKKPAKLSDELAEQIPLAVHLEIGETRLSEKDWKSIKPGDFIILDRCMNDPDTGSGKVKGCLEDKVLFIGNLSDNGSITIT